MSEGAAEAGPPISDSQFGDLTQVGDIPVRGDTAQSPGDGVFAPGWYPWHAPNSGLLRMFGPDLLSKRKPRHREPKKRKREE